MKLLDAEAAPGSSLPTAEHKSAESLKSVLLQLSQADDLPSGMKEAAQQAVQQITGQQLLLNPGRDAVFSQITMFVPPLNGNGEQTASIHIQSRKGKNGRLDASNCHLVFDLQMKSLGNTLLDVQVVNRIVSLHVRNDLPFTAELLESRKDEITEALASIGYQFLSMKCSPYPVLQLAGAEKKPGRHRRASGGRITLRLCAKTV
ncbi:hypothetical protein LJK88_22115 [Paenibacillus sp. P26]|nr:hypothetical protein LJK88_22115 [Paenibacillus sp. P26]